MNLDFSIRSPRPGLVSWLFFVLGLAFSGWTLWTWQDADTAHSAAEHRLASLRAKTTAVNSTQPAISQNRAVATASRSKSQQSDDTARNRMNLPWQRLVAALQTTRPPEIAFLSLDADARRGDFTLTALARNHAAMLAYFDELQRSPGLLRVSLNRHETRDMDGISMVYFSLRGDWAQP